MINENEPIKKLLPDTATVVDGRLQIGGSDVQTLVERYGTPLYLLDAKTIANQIASYRLGLQAHAGGYAIYYACKALLNVALAQLMHWHGVGFDVVSIGELATLRAAGVPLQNVQLHGNATPAAELLRAIKWDIGRLVIDNRDQLETVIAICGDLKRRQTILLRVAPDVAAGGHSKIQTGLATSKFGFVIGDGSALAAIERAVHAPELALAGLHAHAGSQIGSFDAVNQTFAVFADLAAQAAQRWGWQPIELCAGGGLIVPTNSSMAAADVAAYCEATVRALANHFNPGGVRLSIEPGRSLVARAGIAFYSVSGTKFVGDKVSYLHLDGGMGDNIRPALYDARYEAFCLNKDLDGGQLVNYRLAGRYCESGDVIVDDVELPPVSIGDTIGIPVSGAYTLSMASNYNGVGRPPLLLLQDGQVHVMQRRETPEDLMQRDNRLPAEWLRPDGQP